MIEFKISQLAAEFTLSKSTQERLMVGLREIQYRTYLWLYLSIETIRDALRTSLDLDATELSKQLLKDAEGAYEEIFR